MTLIDQLKNKAATALAISLNGQQGKILGMLEKPKNRDHGDLALGLFSFAKSAGKNPTELAKEVAAAIHLPKEFKSAVAVGPFINLHFDRPEFTVGSVQQIFSSGNPSLPIAPRKEKLIVEYSSPNIAKPFHVGHLRATLIGNALDKIYRKLGNDVISINHLGDWGTQFGFVYAGCQIWGKPETETVNGLVDLYKKATALKEAQEKKTLSEEEQKLPDVNAMARKFFIEQENGADYAQKFWQWCSDISLRYFKETYKRIGVHFDHYTGESFYSDKLDGVKAELERSKILVDSEGALGVDLGEELGFARVYTPDGRSLYLTRDLATAEYRYNTFKFDRALYVVGNPQTLHFKHIRGVLAKLGKSYADQIVHVGFGQVLGMKTRGAGKTVELNDLLDEAHALALEAYRSQVSKRPEGLDEDLVAEKVALAAIIFSTLNRTRDKDITFSWEQALAFQGDSGPYILYSFARINGITDRSGFSEAEVEAWVPRAEHYSEAAAFELAYEIERFSEVVSSVVADNDPHHLTGYLLSLAKAVSKAYLELHVANVERELGLSRLKLFKAAAKTIKEGCGLLGFEVLERM
jgi:arginyl-tRNA synthetase